MRKILAPLMRGIRYLMLKLMKRFAPANDGRPALAVADHIVNKAMEAALILFRDDELRRLARIEKVRDREQNRMFNELTVSAVCLSLFCLDAAEDLVQPEYFHFWKRVREKISPTFTHALSDFGLPSEQVKLYSKLITLRYDEYEELAHDIREISESEAPEFRALTNEAIKRSMTRVQAVAIGTADHMMRGTMKPGHPLIAYLRTSYLELNEKFGKCIVKL